MEKGFTAIFLSFVLLNVHFLPKYVVVSETVLNEEESNESYDNNTADTVTISLRDITEIRGIDIYDDSSGEDSRTALFTDNNNPSISLVEAIMLTDIKRQPEEEDNISVEKR